MRGLFIGLVFCCFLSASSAALSDAAINYVAIAMVAKSYCGFSIDHKKLEKAMNYNGLYYGDIAPNGAVYARLRYHYDALIRILQTTPGASCEALRTNMNAGASVWQGVIPVE